MQKTKLDLSKDLQERRGPQIHKGTTWIILLLPLTFAILYVLPFFKSLFSIYYVLAVPVVSLSLNLLPILNLDFSAVP